MRSSDQLHKIVSRLVNHIRVLFQKDGILTDLLGNFVFRILSIVETEGNISLKSTCWRSFGVTGRVVGMMTVMDRGGMMKGGMMSRGVVRDWVVWHRMMHYMVGGVGHVGMDGICQCYERHNGSGNLKEK